MSLTKRQSKKFTNMLKVVLIYATWYLVTPCFQFELNIDRNLPPHKDFRNVLELFEYVKYILLQFFRAECIDMARYMTEREKNVFDVFDVFRI